MSLRADELKFLTLNPKEINSITFESLKCLEKLQKKLNIKLLVLMGQSIHIKHSIKCYSISAMKLFYLLILKLEQRSLINDHRFFSAA